MSLDNKIEEREIVHADPYIQVEQRKKVIEDVGARRRQSVNRVVQAIWLLFGILEAAIGLRVFLKLIAANPSNLFAQLVYSFTDLFLWPFAGLTTSPSVNGFTFEIPSVIAMIVYATVAWVLASLVWIIFARSGSRSVIVSERRRE
jgi:YggT family protein